jgi:hypothetical protein
MLLISNKKKYELNNKNLVKIIKKEFKLDGRYYII